MILRRVVSVRLKVFAVASGPGYSESRRSDDGALQEMQNNAPPAFISTIPQDNGVGLAVHPCLSRPAASDYSRSRNV